MAPDPRLKQLRIATGVLKRLAKERTMYAKELETEHTRLQTMKDELRDEHELRQQMRVIEESAAMVPDTQRRFQAAYDILQDLIQGMGESLAEDEEFKASVAALQEVCM